MPAVPLQLRQHSVPSAACILIGDTGRCFTSGRAGLADPAFGEVPPRISLACGAVVTPSWGLVGLAEDSSTMPCV